MKKLSTKGFAPGALIAAIVVVAVIATAGWVLYSRQQDNKKAEQADATVSQFSDGTRGDAVEGYLGIPELGIQIKLADNVKDAAYEVMADGSTIGLSTQSLVDQFGSGCAASTGNVAQIAVFVDSSGPNFGTGASGDNVYKNAFKSADGVYYAINYSAIEFQPCGDATANPDAARNAAQQVTDGFSKSKVEQLQ